MEEYIKNINSKLYCWIKNGKIIFNDEILFENKDTDFHSFSKSIFKFLEISYPKFFKMDSLSKLAFLASEIILSKLVNEDKNNLALIFANHSSCLSTDIKHKESIANPDEYFPSPAVFVYTLPNICLGEISIRHQLHTESSFFIFDSFPFHFFEEYSQILYQTGNATKVLCGWVEVFEDDYEAFVYLKEFKKIG
jgi:hypothetical protein